MIYLIVTILCGLTIVASVLWMRRSPPDDIVEYPKLAFVRIARVPCRFCAKGLEDNDLVIWFEKLNGWRSEPAHAGCAVLIKKPTGKIERLGGGAPPEQSMPGLLLMTEAEWANWNKQTSVEIGAAIRKQKTV